MVLSCWWQLRRIFLFIKEDVCKTSSGIRINLAGSQFLMFYLHCFCNFKDCYSDTALYVSVVIICGCCSDYMDRFLDEGEGGGGPASWRDNRSSSPNLHALLYGRPPPGIAAGAACGGVEISTPTTVAQAPHPNSATEASEGSTSKDNEASVTYSGLNQMEDLARHLDSDSIESLAKMTSQNNSVSIARTGKITSSPHPMDVDVSISRSSMLSSQTISVEAKGVTMTEAVAQ
ncbi:uncharacterized protein [Panulirus ornatus]|uniref:uncharacterized protein n=1 Tax=Panulirus ornatus TaxID=150431 RepID=UPI003A897A28